MANLQSFRNTIFKLLIHPWLWRVTGFGSSIVGFTCYAFSPSFQYMFGHWNTLKIVVYSVLSFLVSIIMLFVHRFKRERERSMLLKTHVGFVVLILTSVWSFLEDHSEEEGKVKKGQGKIMEAISGGAFTWMAMSLSRQLRIGFEVGLSNFLAGCFLVTVMKMSFKLGLLAALFCYLLVNIRSISDSMLQWHTRHTTQNGDSDSTQSGHQNTDLLNLQQMDNSNVLAHNSVEANFVDLEANADLLARNTLAERLKAVETKWTTQRYNLSEAMDEEGGGQNLQAGTATSSTDESPMNHLDYWRKKHKARRRKPGNVKIIRMRRWEQTAKKMFESEHTRTILRKSIARVQTGQ